MGLMIEGCDVYYFELSDKKENKHYYVIAGNNLKKAVDSCNKCFEKEYGAKATHLETNCNGYPMTKFI